MGNQGVRPANAHERFVGADVGRSGGLRVAAVRQAADGQGLEIVCDRSVEGQRLAGGCGLQQSRLERNYANRGQSERRSDRGGGAIERDQPAPTALAALILPPVSTFPLSDQSGSTDFRIFARRSSRGRFGFCERIKAATPETKGVAIDVPLASLKSCSSQVLRISSPGAAI